MLFYGIAHDSPHHVFVMRGLILLVLTLHRLLYSFLQLVLRFRLPKQIFGRLASELGLRSAGFIPSLLLIQV